MTQCKIDGCDAKHHARGLCARHYGQANHAASRERARRYRERHRETVNARAKDRYYQDLAKSRAESVANQRKRRERIRALVLEAKGRPCIDCGIHYPPIVMEFDHVRGEKLFDIGTTSGGSAGYHTIAEIEAEIAKCDVRCANCHRLRHYREGIERNALSLF